MVQNEENPNFKTYSVIMVQTILRIGMCARAKAGNWCLKG
jgi:hypothetical protein